MNSKKYEGEIVSKALQLVAMGVGGFLDMRTYEKLSENMPEELVGMVQTYTIAAIKTRKVKDLDPISKLAVLGKLLKENAELKENLESSKEELPLEGLQELIAAMKKK